MTLFACWYNSFLSKKKWKLSDSLKEKIAEYAKEDAARNVYMGNKFSILRKSEVAKVAPDRAALMGKINQAMASESFPVSPFPPPSRQHQNRPGFRFSSPAFLHGRHCNKSLLEDSFLELPDYLEDRPQFDRKA